MISEGKMSCSPSLVQVSTYALTPYDRSEWIGRTETFLPG